MPFDEQTVRQDLEKTARKIVSQKLWPILDAAMTVGYSYNQLDLKIAQLGWITPRLGGRRHVYALDLLELWETLQEMQWPELRAAWCERFGMQPPKEKKFRQGGLF